MQIEGIVIETERVNASSSEAGLLSLQRTAAAVTDGISAEQISRSPDSDAGEAIARVTGVSVVDNQFVVVRGLAERYSNTLLNGAELASPEPTRRVVPLNIFPASLLESVLTTKAATPDKPGDFAGGSVEIRTKEFPEERIAELKLSSAYNSLRTFKSVSHFGRRGVDYFGYDGQARAQEIPPQEAGRYEEYGESLRLDWIPEPRRIIPDLGLGVTLGDQLGSFERAIGYVLSIDYGLGTGYTPDRRFQFLDVNRETGAVSAGRTQAVNTSATTETDWGVVANISARLGSSNTLSLRNLWTHESEDLVNYRESFAFDPGESSETGRYRDYQVRYIERDFRQTQLAGNHLLPFLGVTADWKATYAMAARDEPENRALTYTLRVGDPDFRLKEGPQNFVDRPMDEWSGSGQLDLSFPFPWFGNEAGLFKTGGLYRRKDRELQAMKINIFAIGTGPWYLPPDELYEPEIIKGENGTDGIAFDGADGGTLPYTSTDLVSAAYVMTDLPITSSLRLVGGLRVEQWDLKVETGTFVDSLAIRRNELDYLWSANLTYELTQRMNLRAAAFRTVSRPDARELALSTYVPLAGECEVLGDPTLQDAKVLNFDGRWEWFPSPNELIAAGAFYKWFDRPFLEFVRPSQGLGGCTFITINGKNSYNLGFEVELRKNLGFLALENFNASANFTFTDGEIRNPPPDSVTPGASTFGTVGALPLQNQSRYLVNASLGYDDPDAGFNANVLFNFFSDRVDRYGKAVFVVLEDGTPATQRGVDFIEGGRPTIDAKMAKSFGRFSVSLSGENLTNQKHTVFVETAEGPEPTEEYARGVSFSLGVTVRPW
jgi:hypothetical protein